MYESRHAPLAPRAVFRRRVIRHFGVAIVLIGGSLAIGMIGYHYLEKMDWIDAYLNAAMLLGGMGPVDIPQTEAGKLFAGLYALYAGLVLIAVAAMLITPVIHRVLHRFHWEQASRDDDK